jgi:hypothetical protein
MEALRLLIFLGGGMKFIWFVMLAFAMVFAHTLLFAVELAVLAICVVLDLTITMASCSRAVSDYFEPLQFIFWWWNAVRTAHMSTSDLIISFY